MGKGYTSALRTHSSKLIKGLPGFDSKDNGFVSMQADAPEALKTDAKQ